MKHVPDDFIEFQQQFEPSITPVEDLFYGTRGNLQGRIMVVGESWGAEEAKYRMPLVGKSGHLTEQLLVQNKIDPDDCFFTNVVPMKPPGNQMSYLFAKNDEGKKGLVENVRGLYPRDAVKAGLERLYMQIEVMQPDLILGLGNYTLWALTEDCFSISRHNETGRWIPSGIDDWRGSQLYTSNPRVPGIRFLPTYHPAATFRTYAWRGMIRHDLQKRLPLAFTPEWDEPDEYDLQVGRDLQQTLARLDAIADALDQAETTIPVAVDIETRRQLIACIAFAWSKHEAISIPFMCTDKSRGFSYWSADDEFEIHQRIRYILSHPRISIIGQNFVYDAQYIVNELFVLPYIAEDTMIKHHTLFPGGGNPDDKKAAQGLVKKGLGHLSSLYCDWHRYWKDEGKEWNTKMPEEILWRYNARDACVTFEVNFHQNHFLQYYDLFNQYTFQMYQVNYLALPMMLKGVKIDLRKRAQAAVELSSAIAELEAKLEPLVPHDVLPREKGKAPWYRSPQQLARLFYDELGIKPVYGPGGSRTTGKKALPLIIKREPIVQPIVEAIERIRSLGVFYGTFVKAELDHDNRMRCSNNVAGTDTFRWATSENAYNRGTNLQNIPDGENQTRTLGIEFPNIRTLFIPDTGYIIVDGDLAGADAAVVAWESGEEELKDAIRRGIKLHSVTAKELYGTDQQPHYDMCKRRIHATNYGGGVDTLHETLLGLYGPDHTSMSREREFQQWWFAKYPGIKRWHLRTEESLRETNGVRNAFGNRIIYVDRISECFNRALAWVPQSTVALLCTRGMQVLNEEFPFVELLLQVHDSITFQIPKRYRGELRAIRDRLNSIEVPYDDPLCIPWTLKVSNKSWGECEAIKFK